MTDSDRIGRAASLPPPLAGGGRIKRRLVLAWGLWDWGSAAYNAVITTFVFGPYVVRGVVGDTEPGGLSGEHLARHLHRDGRPADRPDRAGHRPAIRRERSPQAQPGHLDRAGRAVMLGLFTSRTSPLSVGGAGPAGRRLGLQRVRRRVLQRDAAAGLDPGDRSAGSPASAGRWATSAASSCC